MKIPFIPKYIRQVINDPPRKIVTAERWNELLNLLITQGDYNTEALQKLTAFGFLQTSPDATFNYVKLNDNMVFEVSEDGETWQATRSSGHRILKEDGTIMPQRSRLRFDNTILEDNGTETIIKVGEVDFSKVKAWRKYNLSYTEVLAEPVSVLEIDALCQYTDSFSIVNGEYVYGTPQEGLLSEAVGKTLLEVDPGMGLPVSTSISRVEVKTVIIDEQVDVDVYTLQVGKGDFIEIIYGEEDAYPNNNEKDGHWYTLVDDSWMDEDILKDTTAALYGLGANAVPDEVFQAANGIMTKNLINILRLKLQQSLKANDIDAWSDSLTDASGINAGESSGYVLNSGAITAATGVNISGENSYVMFGTGAQRYAAQTITPSIAYTLSWATFSLRRSATNATDNIRAEVWSWNGTSPVSLLATSTNVISGTTIPTTGSNYKTFNFSGVLLSAGTTYIIILKRSGALDVGYYMVLGSSVSTYSGGKAYYASSESTWVEHTSGSVDLYLVCNNGTATVVWNAVTPTEALALMAVTADQTAGAGTITWYLSDDGTNWTQIISLDTMQTVNFDVASVRLKCVLTGNAEVRAVAWGGY